ncbi:hypothetical protein GCM10011514_40870 [Emticicia aquatilis]|uniref:DUF1963 domain-containing protein n=1 Tax=Emticicia aquatilis TaxID=1537369 RepID=A0A917DW87_9BACT|nr:hypothetical protein [Emticicia aquatilis]GGD72593.1 hypothetical protein GCM10011514_40870 [Emticicia aquatilis]
MNVKNIIDIHKGVIPTTWVERNSLYKEYIKLTDEEASSLVDLVLNEANRYIEDVLSKVSTFTNYEINDNQYLQLIQKRVLYPSEIYRHASNLITEKLIELFGRVNAGILLSCISWIKNERALEFFQNLERVQPNWQKELNIPAKLFSQCAAWNIENNNLNKLFYDESFRLIQSDFKEIDENLKTFLHGNDTCKCCNQTLTTVFKFKKELLNITNFRLDELDISTCLNCIGYVTIYTKIDDNGKSNWHNSTRIHGFNDVYIMSEIPENLLKISNEKWKPTYSINQPFSILGGYPNWIDDFQFPNCPDCNKNMKFLGQFQGSDFYDDENGKFSWIFAEGAYYFFICEHCLVTASFYQQS